MDPTRKRARTATPVLTESEVRNVSTDTISSSSMLSNTNQHLINEIEKLKTEIAKVQSQRKLDKLKAENDNKRLKRHIATLQQDADDANAIMEQIRQQSEADLDEMARKKTRASKLAEQWEQKYLQLCEDTGIEDDDEVGDSIGAANMEVLRNELAVARQRNVVLEEKVTFMEDEISELNEALVKSNDRLSEAATVADPVTESPEKDEELANLLSKAPPAVLTELNRTRIERDEAKCANRQLTRKIESLREQADQMVKYRELSQSASNKIDRLELELKKVRKERENLRVVSARWVEFRRDLVKHNLGSEVLVGKGDEDENFPPEISSLNRQYKNLENRIKELESQLSTVTVKNDMAQRQKTSLQQEKKELEDEISKLTLANKDLQNKNIKVEDEFKRMKSLEENWKRQVKNANDLLETYKMEEQLMNKNEGSATLSSAAVESLERSLSATKEEVLLLKNQLESIKSEKDQSDQELDKLKEEHEQVRAKFMKLRDALFEEKAKVEKAEERALKAETLAGKGSYNEETTRVLHFQDNPTSRAIKEKYERQLEELKAELADLSAVTKGVTTPSNVVSDPALDAEKFSKRLKDQFRNQIALFREGVYIITGETFHMTCPFHF